MIKLAVAMPRTQTYSETFIRAHIERLPAQIVELYGTSLESIRSHDDQLIFPGTSLLEPLKSSIRQHLTRQSPADYGRKRLGSYLREKKVDALLAEYGVTGLLYYEMCNSFRIPLIVHFHGYDAYQFSTLSQHKDGYKRMFETASAIIAVSHDMMRQLESIGAPSEKLRYNPYGVDLNQFGQVDLEGTPPAFLSVGRFVNKKAPILTILAFSKVLDAVPDAHLRMIGDGPLLEACIRLCRALKMEGSVDFLGACEHSEVIGYMKNSRAYVQHSLRACDGDSEGTPVAILEASAAGLPIVSTYHGGIPDVIVHGKTGLLVEEEDVSAMAHYMIQLANQPALASRLGEQGRIRVQSRYSIEESISNLSTFLTSAIEHY